MSLKFFIIYCLLQLQMEEEDHIYTYIRFFPFMIRFLNFFELLNCELFFFCETLPYPLLNYFFGGLILMAKVTFNLFQIQNFKILPKFFLWKMIFSSNSRKYTEILDVYTKTSTMSIIITYDQERRTEIIIQECHQYTAGGPEMHPVPIISFNPHHNTTRWVLLLLFHVTKETNYVSSFLRKIFSCKNYTFFLCKKKIEQFIKGQRRR